MCLKTLENIDESKNKKHIGRNSQTHKAIQKIKLYYMSYLTSTAVIALDMRQLCSIRGICQRRFGTYLLSKMNLKGQCSTPV